MIFQDIQAMDESRTWHSTFQQLNIKAREKAGSQKIGKSVANRIYNRYRDVVPYDHSLVHLRNSDTEYINANLVKVAEIDKDYILTQGPLANTCKHFWAMVWEQNTYSVVMLNKVVEKNQLKCHQYWPLSGSLTAGNFEVTVKAEEDFNEYVVRDVELRNTVEDKTRLIKHFHYTAWPDFGVPRSPQAFLKYLFHVREYQSSIPGVGAPVIHCSAGIGRSGTFALIDAALTEIKQKDDMMEYDVKKVLLEMRTYRAGLIQTMEQLRFSYIAILEGANTVAPEAYGSAYWKMVKGDESDEEEPPPERNEDGEQEGPTPERNEDGEQEEQEEEALLRKRKEEENEDQDGEPSAKEPRKEGPASEVLESSDSEGVEDEVIDLADVDEDENEDTSRDEGEDFREVVPPHGPTVASDELRELDGQAGGITDEGGTVEDDVEHAETNAEIIVESDVENEANEAISQGHVGNENNETISEDHVENETNEAINEGHVENETNEVISDGHVENETNEAISDGHVENENNEAISDDHVGNETNEVFIGDRDIRTTTSTTQDARTDQDTEEQRHEHVQGEASFENDDHVQPQENHAASSSDHNYHPNTMSSNDMSVYSSDEQVVGRWHPEGAEGTLAEQQHQGGVEPRPKRSSMRTNSAESKRKSVSFVEENGEADIAEKTSDTEEQDREGSTLRRRQIEDRKQQLSDKVDSIKKKMKDGEGGGSSFFGKTMIAGLIVCAVVAGVALLYYNLGLES